MAEEVKKYSGKSALVLALEGNLGAGKTTFTQSFAKSLGIKEKISSPTFVLMKVYKLPSSSYNLKYFVHIDCYRLDSAKDLQHLGFKDLLMDKDAVVVVEWADRIKKILPKDTIWIKFEHGEKPDERILKTSKGI